MEENWNQDSEKITGKKLEEKKSKRGFAEGLLYGIAGTVIVASCIILAYTGILKKQRIKIEQEFEKTFGYSMEDVTSEEKRDGKGDVDSTRILNSELLSEATMINAYLEEYYLYDVDVEDVQDGMLLGMIAALGDPYSSYYNEEELASFQDSTEGEYVGIGAAVTQEISTGIVKISKPYAGTPSAEAGLLPGDVIVSVDKTEVTGMDLNQVVSLIKGEEGTTVVLKIYREEEETYMDVSVKRRKVEIPTVTAELLEDKTGYIEITGFEGVTAKQFILAYEDLKAQGMKQVIFDLRDNGGGLVDTVEEMLDYLLPKGDIFYVKDKKGTKSMEYSSDADGVLDIPAVVLVNENTASAAEIFAGNIQEFGLGTIVGTTTFGKGVMQQLFYTNEERTSAVKLTVADYYIHGDKNIHEVGITPDVEVELEEDAKKMLEIPVEEDNQLQKALEILK